MQARHTRIVMEETSQGNGYMNHREGDKVRNDGGRNMGELPLIFPFRPVVCFSFVDCAFVLPAENWRHGTRQHKGRTKQPGTEEETRHRKVAREETVIVIFVSREVKRRE